jgi:hypothetical protein
MNLFAEILIVKLSIFTNFYNTPQQYTQSIEKKEKLWKKKTSTRFFLLGRVTRWYLFGNPICVITVVAGCKSEGHHQCKRWK